MKHRLDLSILLPDAPDVRDLCVQRLCSSLSSHQGVEQVHVVDGTGDEPAQVCVHHDDGLIPLAQIESIARQVGARLTDRYLHRVWRVEGLGNPRRARAVVTRVEHVAGVEEASVTAGGALRVAFDRNQTDDQALRLLRYRAGT